MCEHNSTKNADHYGSEMTEETVKVRLVRAWQDICIPFTSGNEIRF